jgi:hypothetical protein
MKALPPWFVALCVLFVITAAGAYATRSLHKTSESFVDRVQVLPASPPTPSYSSLYASVLPTVFRDVNGSAPPSASYYEKDEEWPEREFLDVPYNINQVIQQNVGNLSIFPSEKNLALASSIEENDKRDYSLVSKYVSNAENSSVLRPIVTAMDPTDKSIDEIEINCKDKKKVSVREMIRLDGGKSLSEGGNKVNSRYEIKYVLQ